MKRLIMAALFLMAAGGASAQTDTTRQTRPATKMQPAPNTRYPERPTDSLPRKDTLTPIDPRNSNPENRELKNGTIDPSTQPKTTVPAPSKKRRP